MPIAYQYCTGRVDVYYAPSIPVSTGYPSFALPGTIPLYVGTCEQYPAVQGGQNWNPFFADQTGCMEPAEWEYQGDWKVLALDLNKFSQYVLSGLVDNGRTVSIGGLGYDSDSGIGQLMQGNGKYFCMWLRFGNFGSPVAVPDMPPGEFYPCCRLVSHQYSPMGTVSRTTQIVVRTKPYMSLAYNSTLTYSTQDEYFIGLPPPDTV